MSHDYHPRLPGYDERQILKDGCAECEERGKDLRSAFAHMDDSTFERAWKRAFDDYASNGGGYDAVGPTSQAERDVLGALWAVMLAFERRGFPLTGVPPAQPLAALASEF